MNDTTAYKVLCYCMLTLLVAFTLLMVVAMGNAAWRITTGADL